MNQFIKQPEPVIKFAAVLCVELKKSGTGSEKLDILRKLLVTNRNATGLEGLQALEASKHVREETLNKARHLVFTGKLPETEQETTESVEDAIIRQNAEESARPKQNHNNR